MGEYHISARRDSVWRALNDPAILRQAIPGCESITQTNDTEMEAIAVVKVGPVKAKFKGQITLTDMNPPHSYTIQGEGKGGAAGFAKGTARVRLTETNDTTVLNYDLEARIGGKLAQIGQRLIDQTANMMADRFFDTFAQLTGDPSVDAVTTNTPVKDSPCDTDALPEQPEHPLTGLTPMVWISGLIFITLASLLIMDKLPTRFPQF